MVLAQAQRRSATRRTRVTADVPRLFGHTWGGGSEEKAVVVLWSGSALTDLCRGIIDFELGADLSRRRRVRKLHRWRRARPWSGRASRLWPKSFFVFPIACSAADDGSRYSRSVVDHGLSHLRSPCEKRGHADGGIDR